MDDAFDIAWVDRCKPVRVFKQDARSRVWRIDAPKGKAYVVKRFEHSPLRQRLAAMLGFHPGQRELRCYDLLKRESIPTAPIIASGTSPAGLGVRFWLVTPYFGTSLHNLFNEKGLAGQDARRGRVLTAAGRLTGDLIRKGLFNRDHKASNILIDSDDRAHLIDFGSVRRGCDPALAKRMLDNLDATLAQAGASERDRALLRETADEVSGKA